MLNKRACRTYFDPKLKMRDTGLLHARQVDYIIRTAVKTIDHARILVLFCIAILAAGIYIGRRVDHWTDKLIDKEKGAN